MLPTPSSVSSASESDVTFERVYNELRQLAKSQMAKEYAYSTLQGTALVHEAWLRVGAVSQPKWKNRRHLFAAVSQAMKRILVERARKRSRAKHGGLLIRVGDGDVSTLREESDLDQRMLRITEALEKFEAVDPRKAELVRLRYIFGLSFEEAAKTLDISLSTAKRWWVYARSWLHREFPEK